MKQIIIIIMSIIVGLVLASCGHNVDQLEIGKFASIGSPEYGKIKYADGVGITTVGKENTRVKVEIDNTTGITMDPQSGSLKGINAIEIETGPQMTGYITEASRETTAAYFAAVTEYYKARQQPSAKVSDTKSTTATGSVSDVVKTAVTKIAEKVTRKSEEATPREEAKEGAKEEPKADPEKAETPQEETQICTSYDDLDGDCDIKVQRSNANMLMEFADGVVKNSDGVILRAQLIEFLKVMDDFEKAGKTQTNLRLSKAKICNKVLTFLEVVHYDSWHDIRVIPCISCELFED